VRREYVEQYRVWDREEFSAVAFSDECYIYMDDCHGRIYVTRRDDEEWDEDCLVPTFKQSSVHIMIWACIVRGQKGPLVVLQYKGGKGGGLSAARYQEQVLEPVLEDWLKKMEEESGFVIFQQDGAPSHKAKATLKWFSDRGISLLFHPPNSPDLNPIEHVWNELKRRLRNLEHHPTNLQQLIEAVENIWEEIPLDIVNRYIDRMPEIVQALKSAKGGHTKF
jgi:hypothetical protein